MVTPSQGETPRPDPTDAVRKACDALLLTSPVAPFPEGKGAAAGYDLVGTSADYLANEIVKQKDTEDTTAQNRAYIQIRLSYKVLRRWTNEKRGAGNELERRTAGARLDKLEEALDDALKAAGLFAPFSATLMTGPSFTDTKYKERG